MCAHSHHIREKHNWWEKVKDEAIVGRWREEALQRAKDDSNDDEKPEWKLTPAMVRPASHLRAAASVLNRILQGQVHTRGTSWIRGSA